MNRHRFNRRPAEDLECTRLICLDENLNESEESRKTQGSLRELNNHVQFFTEPILCFDYIREITHEKIVLIISAVFYQMYSSIIHSFDIIHSIFLHCNDRSKFIHLLDEYPNIVEISTDETHLIQSVNNYINTRLNRKLAFTLFGSKTQKTTRDSKSALWFQLLLSILKQLPYTDQARDEMLNECAKRYSSDRNELEKIKKFRELYTSANAIQWYTAESFLYKLLNEALRSEDVVLLYLFGFYIADLSWQLEEEHRKQSEMKTNGNGIIVYRGQIISSNELDKMKDTSGMEISINSFMSTSKNLDTALTFVTDFRDNQRDKRVLLVIKIEPNLKSVIHADISRLSQNKDEEEILFNLGTVFQISSVAYDSILNIWKIEMTPIDNAYKNFDDFLNLKINEMKSYGSTIAFGRLIFYELGQTEKAKTYFDMFLKSLPDDHEHCPSVYHNLGSIYRRKGELNLARDYYLRAYHSRLERYDPNHPHIASSLRNIGLVYYAIDAYETALKYLHDSLQIEEINCPNDDENKAVTMVHVGMAYSGKKEFSLALKYLLDAYDMYHRILPAEHPDIGWTAGNIGCCYEDQGDLDQALNYYFQSYEINEKTLSSEHEDLTENLNKIIHCYMKKNKYDLALEFCKKKLHEQTSTLTENHPRIAFTLQSMAYIYENQNQFEEALNYYEQSSNMLNECQTFEQEPIIQCLVSTSELYYKYQKFQQAYDTRLDALSLQEEFYSAEHRNIAESFSFIGRLCKYNQNYSEALQYFEKSLKIYQISYEPEHIYVKNLFNQIEDTKRILSYNEIHNQ